MTKPTTALIVLLGLAWAAMTPDLSSVFLGALISPAQAVVGRPLTPVSVAGVGRRTVRRCATGIYDC